MHPKAGRKGKLPTFPQVVGKKPNHAMIYHRQNGQFVVKWKKGNQWVNKTKGIYKEAFNLAKKMSHLKTLNQLPDISLSPLEVDEYLHCKAITKHRGVGLQLAIDQWNAAKDQLPEGKELVEVVKAYVNDHQVKDISIHALVDRWVKEKHGKGSKLKYLRSVDKFAQRIKEAFDHNVRSISAQMLIEWLETLYTVGQFSKKTFNDYATLVRSVIQYAIDHEYLPHNSRIAKAIKNKKITEKVPSFYTPDEFLKIYQKAHPRIKARLLLIAFYGHRAEEAMGFTIQKCLKGNSLIVESDHAKTGERRAIEIKEEVVEFLMKNKSEFDLERPILENSYHDYQGKVMKKNRRNATRHSFISYHLAMNANMNKVAYIAGTSPQKIKSNYAESVTIENAKQWFENLKTIL